MVNRSEDLEPTYAQVRFQKKSSMNLPSEVRASADSFPESGAARKRGRGVNVAVWGEVVGDAKWVAKGAARGAGLFAWSASGTT